MRADKLTSEFVVETVVEISFPLGPVAMTRVVVLVEAVPAPMLYQ
jgi:hypothetical protein